LYSSEDLKDYVETIYTVTVSTGNVRGAGTSAKVFVTLFGEKGDSGKKFLDNAPDNFER
jgi:hypothetical protein